MRRTIASIGTALLLVGGAAAAVGATRTNDPVRVASGPSTGLVRSTKFWAVGPSAEYDFDSGSIGVVNALRVTLPAGSSHDVIVTISMDYRTSPDDRFVIGLGVRRDERYGHVIPSLPSQRPVAAAPERGSATLVFDLPGLPGGHTYLLYPTVNVSHRDNRARIVGHHTVMVVDTTPSI